MPDAILAPNRRAILTTAPVFLAFLACLPLMSGLNTGFQMDDWFQRAHILDSTSTNTDLFIFYTGEPERTRELIESGNLPWWASENFRHANFRYLSTLSTLLDYRLWPNNAWMMHLHSFLWLSAVIVVATRLYRRFMPHSVGLALLAALLYALDDAHSLPTVYLANRNALLATFFGMCCLLFYQHAVQETRTRLLIPSALSLGLALSAAEIGVSTFAYLAAFTLILDQRSWCMRMRSLMPLLLVAVCWALLYRIGEFGVVGSGVYLDPMSNPAGYLKQSLFHACALIVGQWTFVPADFASITNAGIPWIIAGACTLSVIIWWALPLLKHSATARFWLTGSLLSLVPVVATAPQNRLLFFVGIGAMGLLAQQSHSVWIIRTAGFANRARFTLAITLLITHVFIAPLISILVIEHQNRSSTNMLRAAASLPDDETIREKTIILMNTPDYVYLAAGLRAIKLAQEKATPHRLRTLANGSAGMTVLRTAEKRLQVTLPSGLFPTPFSRYYRSRADALQIGESITLPDVVITIDALNAGGEPATISFEFSTSINAEGLLWQEFREGKFITWHPPKIGEAVTLKPVTGIFSG